MKIFDTHTHVFPDAIASRALEILRARSKMLPVFHNGTYADHREKALQAGYTAWMNCPVVTHPEQASHTNRWVAEHNEFPAFSLGGIHPDTSDIDGVLDEICDLGLHGVKLHPEYQEFRLLEPRMERLWNALEKRNLPVLFHGGIDIGMPEAVHTNPKDFAEFSRRHPGIRMVIGHLGGWQQWDDVESFLCTANVYMDTSFCLPYMGNDRDQMVRIIRKHGMKRILYGTDSPWAEPTQALGDFLSLPLSPEEQQAILWDNAIAFWGLAIRD